MALPLTFRFPPAGRMTLKFKVAATSILLAMTGGCMAGAIAASALASHALTSATLSGIGGDFKFDSVTWARTPTDTNTLTISGKLIWSKSRTGASNTPYWDITGRSGGPSAVSVELVDSLSRAVMTATGALTVWDGKERITMVPDKKPVRFELHTNPISPNVIRTIKLVRMKGLVVKTM